MKSSELGACWELGPQQAHGLWGKGGSASADCAQGNSLEPLSVCKRQNLESLQGCPGLPRGRQPCQIFNSGTLCQMT